MFNYIMSETGRKFHECDKFVKMLCGPFGSGKSCCCAVDLLTYACAQAAAPDGKRYSRWGVLRATYPELTGTTLKSLREVLPPECGSIRGVVAPLRGVYTIPLPDGTTVQLELDLIAIKDVDRIESLKSYNWTGAWINEATGVSPEVFTMVSTRTGRYPSQDLGGASWGGIIMDFNQPAPGSWLDVAVKNPEANWGVFLQPPAAFMREDEHGKIFYDVNPDAENLRNLGAPQEGDPDGMTPEERGMRYYRDQINAHLKQGRDDVVQNMYCMLDVPVVDGKVVYSNFSKSRHVAQNKLNPIVFHDILIGLDQSGIHPAAVVLQYQNGRWCVLDELYADGEGFENFLHGMLVPLLRERYPTNPVTAAIDPSDKRDDVYALTTKRRLADVGIVSVSELTNKPKLRIQTVEHMLNLEVGGLLVCPSCELLIRGFVNEYRYRRLRASGTLGAAYTPQPEKNDASHIHDALQYAALFINGNKDAVSHDLREVALKMSDKRKVLSRVV